MLTEPENLAESVPPYNPSINAIREWGGYDPEEGRDGNIEAVSSRFGRLSDETDTEQHPVNELLHSRNDSTVQQSQLEP